MQCNQMVEVVCSSPTTRSCACCNTVLLDVHKEATELQGMDVDASHAAGTATDAAQTSAAATAAADVAAGGSHTEQSKKRKVRRARTTAEKVRLQHGKNEKTPAARFSVLHLAAPIQTPQEERLFWELYSRYTRGGRTRWHAMVAVWNYRANQLMARHEFSITLKSDKHLKDFHKHTTKRLLQQASAAAHSSIAAAGAPVLSTMLGFSASADQLRTATLLSQAGQQGAVGHVGSTAAAGAVKSMTAPPPASAFAGTSSSRAAGAAAETGSPAHKRSMLSSAAAAVMKRISSPFKAMAAATSAAVAGSSPGRAHVRTSLFHGRSGGGSSTTRQQHDTAAATAAAAGAPTPPAAAAAAVATTAIGRAASTDGGHVTGVTVTATQQKQQNPRPTKGNKCRGCDDLGHRMKDNSAVLCKDPAEFHHQKCFRSGLTDHKLPKSGAPAKSFKGVKKSG